jgi:hypothetical protein
VTYGRSVVSSTNKNVCHDITEILLKVALNKPNHPFAYLSTHPIIIKLSNQQLSKVVAATFDLLLQCTSVKYVTKCGQHLNNNTSAMFHPILNSQLEEKLKMS